MRTSRLTHSSFVAMALILVLTVLFTFGSAWATFPGKNGRIAFVAKRSGSWQLYTINPDGSDIVQITDLPATDFDAWFPVFSPDGRRIVFCRDTPQAPGAPDLYVVNADGTGLTRLTFDGDGFGAHWSPHGTRLTFARFLATGKAVISTTRADATGKRTNLTHDAWDKFWPMYTPNGRHIIFFSATGGLISAVWIMNSDGSDKRRLTAPALEGFAYDVSPDGHHIVLNDHQSTPRPTSIFVMNLDGTNLTRLTNPGKAHDGQANYSPDGSKIVFTSDRGRPSGGWGLYIMNRDGSDVKRIMRGLTVACPDGNCATPTLGGEAVSRSLRFAAPQAVPPNRITTFVEVCVMRSTHLVRKPHVRPFIRERADMGLSIFSHGPCPDLQATKPFRGILKATR
jgi:Tol biopolymer transport system component